MLSTLLVTCRSTITLLPRFKIACLVKNYGFEGSALNVQTNSSVLVHGSNFTQNRVPGLCGAVLLLNDATGNFSHCNF